MRGEQVQAISLADFTISGVLETVVSKKCSRAGEGVGAAPQVNHCCRGWEQVLWEKEYISIACLRVSFPLPISVNLPSPLLIVEYRPTYIRLMRVGAVVSIVY